MQNVQQNKNTYFDQQKCHSRKAEGWSELDMFLHSPWRCFVFLGRTKNMQGNILVFFWVAEFSRGKNELYFLYSATTPIISQLFCSRHKVNTGDSHARLLAWPGIVQLQSNMLLPSSLQLAISSILACRPTTHTCTVFSSSQNWNAASLSKSHICSK